jgi:hypothetical protein
MGDLFVATSRKVSPSIDGPYQRVNVWRLIIELMR